MTGKSLAKAPGYAVNVVQKAEAPTAAFDPTQVSLGSVGFTAWVRSGLIAMSAGEENGRPFVRARVSVSADGAPARTVDKTVALYGARDVIRIDPGQVVRREPARGALVDYGGTLAHVEFDKPELPWMFSPVGEPADGRLRPWIALVVVEYGEGVSLELGQGDLPPVLTCSARELPPHSESWAWAHAQVMGGTAGLHDKLTDAHGPQNLSRLICPRRLEDEKRYLACVVPTFAQSRDAGLGLATLGTGDAWSAGADIAVRLPVYDHWDFSTSVTCDFEELARRLKPVIAPAGVGRRRVDVSSPRGELPDDQSPVQTLKCALYSPVPSPGDDVVWSPARTEQLRGRVDQGSSYAPADPLPRVSPRLYAQFQRGQFKTPAGDPARDWFGALNLDPLARVAAGLGTRVVRRDQEPLMRSAWAQVGEVEAANQAIAAIQFARFIGKSMIERTIGKAQLNLGVLAQMTSPVQGKIPIGPDTLRAQVAQSVMPLSATSSTFRRITGPNSKAVQAFTKLAELKAPVAPFAALLGKAALADLRRLYVEPDSILNVSEAVVAGLPAGPLRTQMPARGFKVQPVLERIARGQVLPAAAVDVVAARARRREARLRPRVESPKLTAGQREALGAVLADIATFAPADLVRGIDQRLARLAAATPLSAVRQGAGSVTGPKVNGVLVGPGGFVNRGLSVHPSALTRGISPAGTTRFTEVAASMSLSPRDRFLRVRGTRPAVQPPRGGVLVSADRVARALQEMVAVSPGRGTPDRPGVRVTAEAILRALDPVENAIRYARARVTVPAKLGDWFADGLIRPVMAAPSIQRPMYEALVDYDRDWLVPGLTEIPHTDFVTLLLSNTKFIEAFMVGLSDEMGRELLWRGYPTDQRGTYFRRFWSRDTDELAADIDRWKKTPLGQHYRAGGSAAGGAERVVLMIKGALVRKIPHALVVAVKGTGEPKSVQFATPPETGTGAIIFRTALDADTLLVGFDLTAKQILDLKDRATRWWFLIADHPTAPRFGLDIPTDSNRGFPQSGDKQARIDALDWDDLPVVDGHLRAVPAGPTANAQKTLGWGSNAALTASMLLQKPVRAAFDAAHLLDTIGKGASPPPPAPLRRRGGGLRPVNR